jgi:RNA polymerase sigma-70 factor (ECF subfamily)
VNAPRRPNRFNQTGTVSLHVCDDSGMDGKPDRSSETPAAGSGQSRGSGVAADLGARLAAIANGDNAAFAEFYDLTSSRVFGLANRVVRNQTLAEDVAQEVYLQVWTSAARQYDPALASPIGWLMTLTHRRSVDRVRSEQSAADRNHAYGASNLGREHDTVADEVGQRLDEQQVTDCLDGLTEVQREAIGLAYYSGHTYREVAEHLDVTLPTIKSRIRDGLIRLKNCLGVGTDA